MTEVPIVGLDLEGIAVNRTQLKFWVVLIRKTHLWRSWEKQSWLIDVIVASATVPYVNTNCTQRQVKRIN